MVSIPFKKNNNKRLKQIFYLTKAALAIWIGVVVDRGGVDAKGVLADKVT